MSAPTATDVRTYLEGYGVTAAQLTDDWITARLTGAVIPFVERITRQKFSAITTVTEYYSGNGRNILMLNRRPIVAVTQIRYVLGGNTIPILNLAMIQTIAEEGTLKAKSNYEEAYLKPVFAKGDQNIEVTYTYGYADYPADVKEAVIYLAVSKCLNFIGARTGGGAVSMQGYNRNYGPRGKYTDLMNQLDREAHALLRKYMTGVVGS